MSTMKVAVSGTSRSATRLDVSVRGFDFVIDEPPALGGADAGPNPVEYVLAGFAGCINVMVHLVARERGTTIRSLSVRAEGELDTDRLMGKSTDARAGFAWIRVTAEVDAEASVEEVEEILRIAESRCPVADNLGAATPVELVRVEAAAAV